MGVFNSKLDNGNQSTGPGSETSRSKTSKAAVFQQELIYWEKVYQERFARKFIYSHYTQDPLFLPHGGGPTVKASPWTEHLDPDSHSSRCNPRYKDTTPEPLSKKLADQTRDELRKIYYDLLLHGSLRQWMRLAWMTECWLLPRIPYLTDKLISPPASQIRNGHILPSRVRSYISGEAEETPLDRDAFSKQRLGDITLWPNINDLSQLPDDNMLLTRCSWLNQTTAMYFEPEFENLRRLYLGVPYIGRGLFAAWHKADVERGREPNLQQMRYFAHPIMLLGGPEQRPIADVIATHRRMCNALADAQNKPVGPKDPFSWVEHGAEMGVVYPSIIIVVDDARDGQLWRGGSEAEARANMFEHFSVLLVRTGNEEHLSEPIDLSGIGDAMLALGRDEVLQDNQQVVRVCLDTAVRFVMDLEHREQDRCPRLTAIKKILDRETFIAADKFAADSLAMAYGNGSIDRNYDTWVAVRRARACLDGDSFHVDPKLVELDKKMDYCAIRTPM
ncbi:hypothetical protein KVR01_011791 [Diaporthe batatas]|uniref:uncharacterized protein n=1 Tax=Diaporthe batatas TaxID=748121 RepID=UPI001D03B190|nr:uncharacterized protein KVR01_011791 [Diaporthe batatas]KAG8158669.1 hypothetical protein KVR01_011791 [Diaporthe batatas]